jgi:hypothetical protein
VTLQLVPAPGRRRPAFGHRDNLLAERCAKPRRPGRPRAARRPQGEAAPAAADAAQGADRPPKPGRRRADAKVDGDDDAATSRDQDGKAVVDRIAATAHHREPARHPHRRRRPRRQRQVRSGRSTSTPAATAHVRMRRDVRLRGEALSREKRGLRATFIYNGDDLPDGYRFVGYEPPARRSGPLTVAVVKSNRGHDGDDVYRT